MIGRRGRNPSNALTQIDVVVSLHKFGPFAMSEHLTGERGGYFGSNSLFNANAPAFDGLLTP